ncbi:putative oxidoreductase YkvO OS=Bacillus subtilis (strain 168) GN=ykvO PE=3 SV=1 [Rhizoctonia solani AG-1 IB]|uniref:Putative oxidoreductase YkvO n=1 Tax=Thanatephorus cucumeris (strain AG1-IB / isolate 7/3/14) TaxID=1108050 RepID=M5CAZ1_THACB|nr:putative oxidoreductase ykvO [Rhizoctonia solani AG-1 IB]CEL55037.1 putative oxidoreductase YkvO OS=Bacillus subtilis (strain 168) GN=ykvO PE=3 SV=1 [Rhizoctonia solani AG-1 IB]
MSNSASLLRGKKVLVIGGSSGIGRSVAAAALSNGASVVISSSSSKKVDTAVERLKQESQNVSDVTVKGRAVDLKDQDALKAFLSEEAPFDHLVITAGGLPGRLQFPEVGVTDAFKSEFDVRYWAIVAASQHIANNKLINPGGSVTFTIGTSYYRPPPGWGLMVGIGGAVEASTRGFAVDLKPIRFNTIAPGVVDTELLDTVPPELKSHVLEKSNKELPVGHVGTPDEVAEAYIFAMKCTYLTGQVIAVDGGQLIV